MPCLTSCQADRPTPPIRGAIALRGIAGFSRARQPFVAVDPEVTRPDLPHHLRPASASIRPIFALCVDPVRGDGSSVESSGTFLAEGTVPDDPRNFDEVGVGTLIAALRRRPLALVGAGSSYPAGYPSWSQLLALLAQEVIAQHPDLESDVTEASKIRDLAVRAAIYKRYLGQVPYEVFLKKTFGPEDTHVADLPLAIVRLPFRHVLTTNYDAVLETAHANAFGSRPPRVLFANRAEMAAFLGNLSNESYARRYVFLHGRFSEPNSIVLTEDDYKALYLSATGTQSQYFAMLATHPVVSVGFSLEDTDVMSSFRFISSVFGKSTHHVAILPSPEGMSLATARTFYREKFGIEPVFYERTPDHAQVITLLQYATSEVSVLGGGLRGPEAASSLVARLDRDLATASTEFANEEYSAASGLYHALVTELDRLVAETPQDRSLQTLAARALLGLCSALLTLGDSDNGAKALARISPGALEHRSDRLRYARNLIRTGDFDRAELALQNEPDDADARPVREFLELKRGRVPETLSRVDWLFIEAGVIHLTAGRLDAAGLCALEAATITSRTLIRASALRICIASLLGSAAPDAAAAPVPAAQRRDLVRKAEELAADLEDCHLPPRIVGEVRLSLLQFYIASFDPDGAERVARKLRDAGQEVPEPDARFHEALVLASSGRVADAIQRLDAATPEVWRRLQTIQLFRAADDLEAATDEALRLVADRPGVAEVEREAAALLLGKGDSQGALIHARRAYQAFPGTGQRLTLAQSLITGRNFTEANALLETLLNIRRPDVLRARAIGLDATNPTAAVAVWRDYLSFERADARTRVHLAAILFSLGRVKEAADEAFTAATSVGGHKLPARALFECALLQSAAGFSAEILQPRLKTLANLLQSRRETDASADGLFLQLFFQLEAPKDLPPPDMKRLEALGLVQTVTIEDAASHMRALNARNEALWTAYGNGLLSFAQVCRLTRAPTAAVIASAVASRGSLPTPAWAATSKPVDLAGTELLLGQLEFLVLHQLELLHHIESLCERGARLVLFEDVRHSIANEAVQTSALFHPSELERYRTLWGSLSSASAVHIRKAPQTAGDLAWSQSEGLRLISRESARHSVSPVSVAAWLRQSGVVPPAVVDSYLARVGENSPVPTDPGARLAIDFVSLVELNDAGLLQVLIQAGDRSIHVGAETTAVLMRRITELELQRDAANRARAVHEFVGHARERGWLTVIERPVVTLPPFRAPGAPEFLREGIAEALTWRIALLGHKRRRLLSCDFLVTSLFTASTPRELIASLAWTPPIYRTLVARIRKADRQSVALPDVLPTLVQSPAEYRRRLAELGFSSALQWQDILALAREFGGLAKVVPQRILNGFERIARDPQHPASRMAMLEVVRRYAHCIWAVFYEQWAEPERTAFTDEILKRLTSLDSVGVGRPVETALRFFGSIAASNPLRAFVPISDDHATLSDESSAGKAWACLFAWANGNRRMLAALERGIHDALLAVDAATAPDGPSELQFGSLMLGLTRLPKTGAAFSMAHSGLAPVAILSSRWGFRPLNAFHFSGTSDAGDVTSEPLEDVLTAAASLLETGIESIRRDGESWIVESLLSDGRKVDVSLPPEAVLLRSRPDAVRSAARALADEVGIHDGQEHSHLLRLADAPECERRRNQAATRAAAAPWRTIRADPTSLLLWGIPETAPLTLRNTDDLLALLSEPSLLGTREFSDHLHERVEAGGAWEKRDDAQELLQECLLSSWPLALNIAAVRASQAPPADVVRDAVQRLRGAKNFAHAIVAVDITAALLAAVRGAASSPEVLAEVAATIEHVLVTEAHPAEAGTFMAVESRIMAACADAVTRICGPTIGFRDYVWLSRRLYQWFFRQLQFATQDSAQYALSFFSGIAGGPTVARVAPDVLDIRSVDPEVYNARLAVILYALNAGLQPENFVSTDFSGFGSAGNGTLTEATLGILAELASRPLTPYERELRASAQGSQLEPWRGPRTVPDLAIAALLHADERSFVRLTADARMRWLQELAPPAVAGPSGPPTLVAIRLMFDVARNFDALTDDEIQIIRSRTVADLEWPAEWEPMRLLMVASLYDRGHVDVEPHFKALARKTLANKGMQHLVSALYEVAAKRSPALLGDLVSLTIETVSNRDDMITAVSKLDKLLTAERQDVRETARDVLLRVADTLGPDPQFDRLLEIARRI